MGCMSYGDPTSTGAHTWSLDDAERETVDCLIDTRVRAILRWYTGPLAVAEDALAGGLWFSVNPAMAASTRSRALLSRLPPDRVLLETDGPFARHGGRAARPGDLVPLVRQLAEPVDGVR